MKKRASDLKKYIDSTELRKNETKLKEDQMLYPKLARSSSISSISSKISSSNEPQITGNTVKVIKKNRSRAQSIQPVSAGESMIDSTISYSADQ